MIEFLVISLIISSDTSLSENIEESLLNSRLNSPKEISFEFTFNGDEEGAEGSVKQPPTVATSPNIRIATIIDDPVEESPDLIF